MGNKISKSSTHEKLHSTSSDEIIEQNFLFQIKADLTHHIYRGYGLVNGVKYYCYLDNQDGYYHFTNTEAKATNYKSLKKDSIYGWKIHISLKNFSSIISAWNAIAPFLFKYGVFEFKVRPEHSPTGTTFQPGKDIVIYLSSSRADLPWLELLIKIETTLCSLHEAIQEGANPTYRIGKTIFDGRAKYPLISEPKINGSKFLYIERDDIELDAGQLSYHLIKDMSVSSIPLDDLKTNLGPCTGFNLSRTIDISPAASGGAGTSMVFENLLGLPDYAAPNIPSSNAPSYTTGT